MTEELSIEQAVALLKEELPNAHSIEIRAQEMPENRLHGVILIWVNSYEEKRAIYEKYGEGENLYPALFHEWEIRVKKYPPFIRKSKTVDDKSDNDRLESEESK